MKTTPSDPPAGSASATSLTPTHPRSRSVPCRLRFTTAIALLLGFASFRAHASTSLTIAEVYGGGGNSGATYQNDYVVLFNPTASGVDVTGWSIQYQSQAGTTWTVVSLNGATVASGGYYLIQLASNGAVGAVIPVAETTNSLNLSATQGKVALVNTTVNLGSQCPASGSIIDKVAYGSTSTVCNETANAPAGDNTHAVQRLDGGCSDTDNNSADFASAAPSPRNGGSATHPCGGGSPPDITGNPQSQTIPAGATATFAVAANGSSLNYRWRKDGNDVADANATGINSPTLILTNALGGNSGNFDVVVTNSSGSKTSTVAVLTVLDPGIRTQPVSRTNVPGDTANFFVTAGGTPTLTYQWRFYGTNIAGANANSFNRQNLTASDAGPYSVVVSNGLSLAITSSVATLTVLATPSTRIAQWDFNATNTLSVTVPDASSGNGSASLVGGTSAAFAGGSFSDAAGAPGAANSGWNSSTYPSQGSGNKTAGVQFETSTVGYKNILVTWEQRNSNTASKYARLQFSWDGSTFANGPVMTMYNTNNEYVFFYADLSNVSQLNNTNIILRIVSEFESTATGAGSDVFVASVPGNNYNTGGTMRFDLASIYGDSAAAPPTLNYSRSGGNLVLTWNDPAYGLQAAPFVTGTYTNVAGAVSGYSTSFSGNQRYFRLAK